MFKETLTERDDVIGLVCEGKLTETELSKCTRCFMSVLEQPIIRVWFSTLQVSRATKSLRRC